MKTAEEKRKHADYMRNYYRTNASYREKSSALMRRNYLKNKEAIKLRTKEWAKLNPEKVRANRIAWVAKNLEANRKSKRKWHEANQEKVKENRKRFLLTHPDYEKLRRKRRRAREKSASVNNTADTFYRFVRSRKTIPCYYCGKPVDGKKAHIDHILAISKNGNHSSENLCASCPTCNISKGNKLLSEWKREGQQFLQI